MGAWEANEQQQQQQRSLLSIDRDELNAAWGNPKPTHPPKTPKPTNPPKTPRPTEWKTPPTPRPTNPPKTPKPTKAPKTPKPTNPPKNKTPRPTDTPRPTRGIVKTPRPTNPPKDKTPRPTEWKAPKTPKPTYPPKNKTPKPTVWKAPKTPRPTNPPKTPKPTNPPKTPRPTTYVATQPPKATYIADPPKSTATYVTPEPCAVPSCTDPCRGKCGANYECKTRPTFLDDAGRCPGCDAFDSCEYVGWTAPKTPMTGCAQNTEKKSCKKGCVWKEGYPPMSFSDDADYQLLDEDESFFAVDGSVVEMINNMDSNMLMLSGIVFVAVLLLAIKQCSNTKDKNVYEPIADVEDRECVAVVQ